MHFDPYLQGKKNELVIAETERFMAIVEEKPLAFGHCVIFPKRLEDSWTELADIELSEMMIIAKRIAKKIETQVPCQKVGIAVLGLQVRHAHVHLVPLQSADDLNFTRAKLEVPLEELIQLTVRLRESSSLFSSH